MWGIILTVYLLLKTVFCARILVFCPTPSYSHQVIFQPIIRELSLRGHQVVSITPSPINDSKLVNLTELDMHFTYDFIHSQFNFADRSSFGIANTNFIRTASKAFTRDVVELQISHPDVQKIIKNPDEHFDLVIVEWLFSSSSASAFSERFNCPLVGVTSLGPISSAFASLGNSINPSYYTSEFLSFSKPTSLWQRIYSALFNVWFTHFFHTVIRPDHDKIIQQHFGAHYPSVEEIEKRISIVLANYHPAWLGAHPRVPGIINIAGIYKKPRKSLPKDLQTFLDEAKQGAIYFSLGSNVKSNMLPKEKIQIFIEAFKKLPYKILWKFESDELPNKPDNVKISKWLPQSDVLYHPNIKAFITQGGLQSWEEAMHAHVPLLGIPFMGDQEWNVDRIEKIGIGLKLDIDTINGEQLIDAIERLIKDPSYRTNITELSAIINEHPDEGPLPRAVWWIEYVLRHRGAPGFRSPTADLPYYQLFLLDVIVVIAVCITLPVFISCYVFNIWLRKSKKIIKLKRS